MNPGPVYTLMAVFTLGNKIYDTQRCRDDDEYSLFFSPGNEWGETCAQKLANYVCENSSIKNGLSSA